MKHIINFYRTGKLKIPPLLILVVTFSFAFGIKVKADFSLTGPTLICTSGQYTVQNYNNETLVWSSSSNLTLTSTQGQNPATFTATGTGNATVTATITCCGTQYVRSVTLWIGPPSPPLYVTNEAYYMGIAGTWISSFTVYHNAPAYQEAVSNIYGGDDSYYYGQNYWSLYFQYEGLYQIWATNSNTCGESDEVYMYYLGPEEGKTYGYSVYDE
jgi:hypothetical protein